ncbi:MAG TPA: carboxypeptidase-like regulatory domain-containing protein [Pyrinomonadaceae bacterium]|jgi:hypothetical protein|nr:carboxypeptidase-like regulatory domain-containing protein [Pyrinomonadaceae bacterium]
MNESNVDLNRLKIAMPCNIGWDNMQGNESVRHCNSCELNVYNIAEMTGDEAKRLIATREGRLCVRLYRRSDGTVITKDCPVGLLAYRKRVGRLAGAALTVILGLFSVSYGQKTETSQPSKEKVVRTFGSESVIKGTVTDVNGAVIPNAQVTILNADKVEVARLRTNVDGIFEAPIQAAGIYTVIIESQWFRTRRIEVIEVKAGEILDITAPLDVEASEIMGILIDATPIDRAPDTLNLPEVKPRPQPVKKKRKS